MITLRGGLGATAFVCTPVDVFDADVDEVTDGGTTAEESLGIESCVRAFPKNELKLDYRYSEIIGSRSMNALSELTGIAKGKREEV